jgi:heme/copper-type cytochrome/quinol oxidase subunit 2
MKRIIILFLLAICAFCPVFSQNDVEETPAPAAPEFEERDLGNKPILVFGTIFVVVSLILMLRLWTDKMKTKDRKHPRG